MFAALLPLLEAAGPALARQAVVSGATHMLSSAQHNQQPQQ
jgi:hypothetical protein